MSLWIDLTDFLQWKGNLTGIQRIQYNLSKKYIESGRDVHFFVYTEADHRFTEVDFRPDEIVRSGIVAPGSADSRGTLRGRIFKRVSIAMGGSATDARGDIASPFASGDTVLVMGGIWVGDFIDDLVSCKERYGLRFVHFAFDMIPTLFPGYVVDWLPNAFTAYQKKVFTHADGIVAISESTAKDVRNFIEEHQIEKAPAITVVRIGEAIDTGSEREETAAISNIAGLDGVQFILSVSTIEGRKNHAALFYVMKEAKRRGIALPKFVIVGRNGWLTDDIRYMMKNDADAKKGILVLNDMSDEQLVWLYENCRFTIFPSFYEGWGMPIAESLAYGKMCLASDTSSMPEIAGSLLDYFSPYDTNAILSSVVKYLDDDILQKKEAEIAARYKPTSWSDMFAGVAAFVDGV